MKCEPRVRRLSTLLAALGLVATFAPAHVCAQEASIPQALGEIRAQLGPGDTVRIEQLSGTVVRGRLLRVGTADLDVRSDTPLREGEKASRPTLRVRFEEIQSLERPRDGTRNGTLIGAGIGAGIGVALFAHAAAIDANEMDEWATGYVVGALVTTGIGALIGWAIDAAHSKPYLHVHVARPVVAHIKVVPVVRGGRGVAVVAAF